MLRWVVAQVNGTGLIFEEKICHSFLQHSICQDNRYEPPEVAIKTLTELVGLPYQDAVW